MDRATESVEHGAVIGPGEDVLFWHVPPGRSRVALPDSRALWDVLWTHRATLVGFAHTHPGIGPPVPSTEDVTTFAAVEAALGRRLVWWISTEDVLVRLGFAGPGAGDYEACREGRAPPWLAGLRQLSYGTTERKENTS